MEKLGRIERVDLRTVWTNEAEHFTPWLAQPENLEILGETLGIDLELEAQEKDVGPFRADILCKNTAEKDSWVVIENQIIRWQISRPVSSVSKSSFGRSAIHPPHRALM